MNTSSLDERARSLEGRELEWGLGPDEVCLPVIRWWCEAYEDACPLYADGEFAAKGPFGGVIAPPAMLWSFTRPPYWPQVEREGGNGGVIRISNNAFGYSENLVQRIDWKSTAPLRLGDRAGVRERIISVSPEKTTHLGTGRFTKLERRFYNQHDQDLGVVTVTFFSFDGSKRTPRKESPGVVPAGAQPPKRSELESGARRLAFRETRAWKDVQEGEVLPTVQLPLDVTRMVWMAYLSRDFNPFHHDLEYARANGAPHMFVQWASYLGFIYRFLNEWAGPGAWISDVSYQLMHMNLAHDTMSASGCVVRKYQQDGKNWVELEFALSNERGVSTPGTALVSLPLA
ncbi:MAG: MaoC family dehydratase N-terminal domain-containing protein [Rubrivivax sp.]